MYCAKRNKVFNEDDFTSSERQLDKMKKYLGGDRFKFCRSFHLMIERKTLTDGCNNPPAATICPEVNTDNEDVISESDTSTFLSVSSPQFVSAGEEESGRDNSLQLSSSSPSTMAPRLLSTTPESDNTSLSSEFDSASLDTDDLVPNNNVEELAVEEENARCEKRRKQGEVFMEGLKSVKDSVKYFRTKCNNQMSDRLWQQRSDLALQYLINICGLKKLSDYSDMQNNNELFESVQDLIVHVKARLMKHTKLTVCNDVEEENSDVDNLPMPVSDTDHTEALAFEI